MESNVENERFLGLNVYSVYGGIKKNRQACCYHALCENTSPNSYFKCDTCIFSHRHDKEFTIWIAHQRVLGNIHE